jgi:hypothetical protein
MIFGEYDREMDIAVNRRDVIFQSDNHQNLVTVTRR